MTWRSEIEEIHRRRELAEACGGADAVAKHHAQGKLTVQVAVSGSGEGRVKQVFVDGKPYADGMKERK